MKTRIAMVACCLALLIGAGACSSDDDSAQNTTTTANRGFEVQTPDGQVSLSLSGQLPPNWPDDFPVPEGAEPAGSGSLGGTSSTSLVGVYSSSDSAEDSYNFYKSDAGLNVTSSSSVGSGSAYLGTVQFTGDFGGWVVTLPYNDGGSLIVAYLSQSVTDATRRSHVGHRRRLTEAKNARAGGVGAERGRQGDRGDREHHSQHDDGDRHDRVVSIIEAVLLAVVAVLAAWSGYSAAKWGTESRLELARASTARIEANRALGEAEDLREFDSTTFDAWFTAYVAGNQQAMDIAEGRFRPEFEVAFQAWLATDPETNPDAPPGPTYMPEYEQPALEDAAELDASADEHFEEGEDQGTTADDYVRTTVYLATVLFLVGISGHFRFRAARYGLVAVGVVMLVVASIQLIALPKPPLE